MLFAGLLEIHVLLLVTFVRDRLSQQNDFSDRNNSRWAKNVWQQRIKILNLQYCSRSCIVIQAVHFRFAASASSLNSKSIKLHSAVSGTEHQLLMMFNLCSWLTLNYDVTAQVPQTAALKQSTPVDTAIQHWPTILYVTLSWMQ